MRAFATIMLIVISFQVASYEVPTHSWITRRAFLRSSLTDNAEMYSRLGFERLSIQNPFNTSFNEGCIGNARTFVRNNAYADPRPQWVAGDNPMPPDGNNIRFRCPQTYERREMEPFYSGRIGTNTSTFGPTPQLRFEAWLMRGVIREDDAKASFYTGDNRPDPDPWNERDRPFNHFYSPVTNSPDSLQITNAVIGGQPALNWAMGEEFPF